MNNVVLRRKGKLKLMKDLKYGKANLRQSLIELSEFEDLAKTYKSKKQFYSIIDKAIEKKQNEGEKKEVKKIQKLISPEERLEDYRRKKLQKKRDEKMNKVSQEFQKVRKKIRRPSTSQMLDDFQTKYKNEMPISCKQQLRESEINLENLKKNSKRKFEYSTLMCENKRISLSRKSRVDDTFDDSIGQSPKTKSRFLSLNTSLPEKQKQKEKYMYPSVKELIYGKFKNDSNQSYDFRRIDVVCDKFTSELNSQWSKIKNKLIKQKQEKERIEQEKHERERLEKSRNISSGIEEEPENISQKSDEKRKKKSREKSPMNIFDNEREQQNKTVDKLFNKSDKTSKNVINKMSAFYQTKHRKKSQYDELVENLKYDRPHTSNIRRRNYQVVDKQGLSSIKKYRLKSEQQRVSLRKKNYQFYLHLIQGLENYHEEDIPTTIYLVSEVKDIFQTQYEFNVQFLQDIIKIVRQMPFDPCIEKVLQKVSNFLGYRVQIEME